MLRRELLLGVAAVTLAKGARASDGIDPLARFDALLAQVKADPASLEATRAEREGFSDTYDYYVSRAVAPRPKPSNRKIDERAIAMITTFEVSGPTLYRSKYQRPVWPKGESGVTIGVGYDLGYVTKTFLAEDWAGLLPADAIARLQSACGLKGPQANAKIAQFSSVQVPWEIADKMFRTRLLPLYVAETLNRLPNAQKLSDRSLGAMVSLVYNRGGSFNSRKPSRAEMLQIYRHMRDEEYAMVPNQIRAMKRIWRGKPGMAGLLARRDLEADLFESGLKA